jgi:hypothetical protein
MVAFTIPSRTGEFTLQFLQQEWINDGRDVCRRQPRRRATDGGSSTGPIAGIK